MTEIEKLEIFEGMDGAELVQETFLFRELGFDETAKLAGAFQNRSYKAGEHLIEEGAIGDALYIIRSGEVSILKSDGKNERLIATLGKGELVGEMSLMETTLTSASVVAKSMVECLILDRKDLEKMMKQSPALALKVYRAFCHVLSDRLRRTSQELFELRGKLGD